MADQVVTRFAPSPTGYLHVGGGRTALFNWLWARRTGGRFILRIEDTDQKRNTPTAAKQVMADLRWLGIQWDEGPEVGGPNGPYFQSQRTDIYDKYIRLLLDQKKAYYCFESSEELDVLRQEAEAQKKGFVYTRPQQFPSHEEAKQGRNEGKPVTVRFAMPTDQPIFVTDLVRGQIRFDPAELGDFIILKSDGFPTYNFACVVDDALMQVTHVLRGQEHLMNTPSQQALWQALFPEKPLPQYAHMSVTVSDSGGKLSKRERPNVLRAAIEAVYSGTGNLSTRKVTVSGSGTYTPPTKPLPVSMEAHEPYTIAEDELAKKGNLTVEELRSFRKGESTPDMPAVDAMAEYLGVHLPEINIVDFFKSGYLPSTMVNFLALLGWNPGDQREVMRVGELIESFDIGRLTKSNSLFDRQKLMAFNMEHIRMTPPQELLGHLRAYLQEVQSPMTAADDPTLLKIIELCAGARTLAEIDAKCRFAFIPKDQIHYDKKAVEKVLIKDRGLEVLPIIDERLAKLEPFTEQALDTMLRALAEERGVGLGKVAQPLRVALTGTTVSPSIFESVQLLGVPETCARIKIAVARVGGSS